MGINTHEVETMVKLAQQQNLFLMETRKFSLILIGFIVNITVKGIQPLRKH